MGSLSKLFKHSTYYSFGSMMVMLASLITFPIWTRVLSKAEYGYMSLCLITITFLAAISKLGLQHASLRYFSDYRAKNEKSELLVYFSTMVVGSFSISALVILIIGFVSWCILFYTGFGLFNLILLMGLIIFIQSLNSQYFVFLRVEENPFLYSIITIVQRYSRFFLAFMCTFFFCNKVFGILVGFSISATFILGWLSWRYRKKIRINLFSTSLFKQAVIYGSPLVLREISALLLSLGDRYLILYYMGVESVGIYSVGYNISDMSQLIISKPLQLAVMPIYLKMWNSDGAALTQRLLNRTLDYYFMFGIPISIWLSCYSGEIINLLASSKFQGAHKIVPYIIFPMVLNGAFCVYGAGLFIHKKTVIIMWMTLLCAMLNLLLNWILIPQYGLYGAAFATLLSYSMLSIIIYIIASRYLFVRASVLSIIMYIMLSFFVVGILSGVCKIDSIIIKMITGPLLYFVGIMILKREIRYKSIQLIKNLRAKISNAQFIKKLRVTLAKYND